MLTVRNIYLLIPLLAFLVLAGLVAGTKQGNRGVYQCVPESGSQSHTDILYTYVFDRAAARPNFRVLSFVLMAGLEEIVRGAMSLSFSDEATTSLYQGAPWRPHSELSDDDKACLAFNLANLIFVLMCLSPVLLAAFYFYRTTLARTAIICAALWAVIGWHPTMVSLMIMAGDLIADWPRAYFLFRSYLVPYDIMAAGLVVMFFLAIVNWRRLSTTSFVVLAVAGQLTFEYLGGLFLFAAAVSLWRRGADWKPEVDAQDPRSHVRGMFFAVVVAIVGMTGLFFIFGGSTDTSMISNDPGPSAYIANNIAWYNFAIACLITMMGPALLIGSLVTGLAAALEGSSQQRIADLRLEVTVLTAMLMAYLGVFAIGFLTAGYPSDIGRQFMPLSVLCVFLGARATALVVAHWRHRHG